MIVLDTHAWIWWVAEPDKLSKEIIAAHVVMAEERHAMTWAHQTFLHSARAIVRLRY